MGSSYCCSVSAMPRRLLLPEFSKWKLDGGFQVKTGPGNLLWQEFRQPENINLIREWYLKELGPGKLDSMVSNAKQSLQFKKNQLLHLLTFIRLQLLKLVSFACAFIFEKCMAALETSFIFFWFFEVSM